MTSNAWSHICVLPRAMCDSVNAVTRRWTSIPLTVLAVLSATGCGEEAPILPEEGDSMPYFEGLAGEDRRWLLEDRAFRQDLPLGVREWEREFRGMACFFDTERERRWLRGLAREVEHYPLAECLVCGIGLRRDVREDPLTTIAAMRVVRVCSEDCLMEARRPGVLERLDQVTIEAQLPGYPTDLCPIHRVPVDSRGGPHDRVIEGRLVRFCCDGWSRVFREEAEENFAWIDAQGD